MGLARGVHNIYIVHPVDRLLPPAQVPDLRDLLLLQQEAGEEPLLPRPAETDRRGLVPDRVARAQNADQEDHVDRVDRSVEAPAEDRADVVAGAAIQRDFHPRLAKVVRDVGDAPARAPIGGKEVEHPPHAAGGEALGHGAAIKPPPGRPGTPRVSPAPAARSPGGLLRPGPPEGSARARPRSPAGAAGR